MKNRNLTILTTVVVIYLTSLQALGIVNFNDGQVYDIDYEISDIVRVDYLTPGIHTTFNLLDGGTISSLEGYEDSKVNVYGGHINVSSLTLYQNSQATMSGGLLKQDIRLTNNSQAAISGGSILGSLYVVGDSHATLSGGRVYGNLGVNTNAILTIDGSGFTVDGQAVGYGELNSILGGEQDMEPIRHLTGTLSSGGTVYNDFRIGYNAKIVLVPEPTTLLLSALGGLALRKRRQ